jgi:TolB protein
MPLAVRIAVLVLVVSGVLLALALLLGSALPARHVLAYYSLLAEGGAIHLLDTDRSLSVPSYRTSAYIQAMAWSPDAEHIAFITYEDNSYFLNTVAADGRNAHRLTDQTASTRRPVWSPDSQWIAFDSQMVTGTMLFLVGANGTNLRDMMGSGNGASGDLVWSPDGRQVALASWSTGNATFEIFMMDAAPCISGDSICRPKRLTTNSADDRLPTWSPDGEQIAFLSNRSGQWEIYIENADCDPCGRDARQLTRIQVDPNTLLSWSPDGRWITFTVSPIDSGARVYILDTTCATTNCVTLISDKEKGAHHPQWSPDGRLIAYYQTESSGTRIVLLDTACLPDNCKGKERPVTPANIGSWYPVWQP